jgi:hypothetical protein
MLQRPTLGDKLVWHTENFDRADFSPELTCSARATKNDARNKSPTNKEMHQSSGGQSTLLKHQSPELGDFKRSSKEIGRLVT